MAQVFTRSHFQMADIPLCFANIMKVKSYHPLQCDYNTPQQYTTTQLLIFII